MIRHTRVVMADGTDPVRNLALEAYLPGDRSCGYLRALPVAERAYGGYRPQPERMAGTAM